MTAELDLNRCSEMNTINSSTTHHSRPQERKFANKLFIGLGLLVVAAILVALIVGQKREVKPAGTAASTEASSTKPADATAKSNTSSAPESISEQPKQ